MVFNNIVAAYKDSIASSTFRQTVISPLLNDLQNTFEKSRSDKTVLSQPPRATSDNARSGKHVSFDEKPAQPSQSLRDLAYLSEVQSNARRFKTLNQRAKWYNVGATAMNIGFIAGTMGAVAPISAPAAAFHIGAASLHQRWQKQAGKTWSAIKSGLQQADGLGGLDLKKLSYINDKLAKNSPAYQLARYKAVTDILGGSAIDHKMVDEKISRKKRSRDRVIYKAVIIGKSIRKPFSKSAQTFLADLRRNADESGVSRYTMWIENKSDALVDKACDSYDRKHSDKNFVG